jgi:ParB-like nuclease domain
MSLQSAESPGQLPTAVVPIASLLPADSPRVAGVNSDHVRMLAEIETDVPPILVHRTTMRVIDGMHRLHAARQRGHESITVRFIDANERDLFVLAVETNVKNGLPLSHRDRVAAATRVAGSHPHWSDRLIAQLTGLSAGTVAAIRTRSSHDLPPVGGRLGRDGKVRPLNTAAGRRLASDILTERPTTSLREVAKQTGLSLSTVHDVRNRLLRNENPVPERLRREAPNGSTKPAAVPQVSVARPSTLLEQLRRDPSLRSSELGRTILRMLDVHSIPDETWIRLAGSLPPHCTDAVTTIARACATSWTRFAEQIQSRGIAPYSQAGA